MAAEIVIVGSLCTDYITQTTRFPKSGETVFGKSLDVGFGGKGINQCAVAERLGAKTAFVGKLGVDSQGDALLEYLSKSTIDVSQLTRTSSAPSAVANCMVDETGQNCIINIPGANRRITVEDVHNAEDLIKNAKVIVCQNEISEEATKAALILAKKHGVMTVMNAAPALPNMDPEIIKKSDIFCVNESEAEVLTKIAVSSYETATEAGRVLLSQGCGGALVTLGAMGALWLQAGQEPQCVDTEKVKAVDTTGAGDAFLGALAFFIARHSSLTMKEKMKRACAVATKSVQKLGALSSFPTREELPQRLFE